MGMLLARVSLIPYRFTCCDCQVNQRLPFDGSVPVPEAGGDEHPVSFTDLQAWETLKLNKAFPLRSQQHLFPGVIMPLGVRSIHKLHVRGPSVGRSRCAFECFDGPVPAHFRAVGLSILDFMVRDEHRTSLLSQISPERAH